MKDELGTRIKENYENRTRYYLPRRTYTILRLDQKAGHTYTRKLGKPFDNDYMEDLNGAAIATMAELQGAVFGYIQSDEISILLTDFATPQTDAWFDGNIQKMSSVASSILTAEFNRLRWGRLIKNLSSGDTFDKQVYINSTGFFDFSKNHIAYFDCRAFSIPDRIEVMNYFRWRQKDCIRNSVSMVAQSHFSPKELHGKSQSDMHEMLHQKSVNWATDFTNDQKNGRILTKKTLRESVTTKTPINPESTVMDVYTYKTDYVDRFKWRASGAWVFTGDEDKLLNMIPDQYLKKE